MVDAEHMSRRDRIRLAWFRAGAEAFSRLGVSSEHYYVCPLCLHGFQEDAFRVLTFEDVPPKSLGGRRLVLTCLKCNSCAGGPDGVDTHAKNMETVREVLAGSPKASAFVRMNMSDVEVNAAARGSEKGIRIEGLQKNNPTGRTSELKTVLENAYQDQMPMPDFKLSFPRNPFAPKRACVSWLRAAYLAAFADFGYRYIFRKPLDCVRDQIKRPQESAIEGFHQVVKDAESTFRRIILITAPDWARGLHVQMGTHAVFLPFLDNDLGYYTRLCDGALKTGKINIVGKQMPWPTKRHFVLDVGPPDVRLYILSALGVASKIRE